MPVSGIVDEKSTKFIKGPGEAVHCDGAITDLMDEPLFVGTYVTERHVQVARRHGCFCDLRRWRHPLFSSKDRLGIARILSD